MPEEVEHDGAIRQKRQIGVSDLCRFEFDITDERFFTDRKQNNDGKDEQGHQARYAPRGMNLHRLIPLSGGCADHRRIAPQPPQEIMSSNFDSYDNTTAFYGYEQGF